jgi:hypothetical protein
VWNAERGDTVSAEQIPPVPEDAAMVQALQSIVRAAPDVLAQNWTPEQKAKYLGANLLPVGDMLGIKSTVKAQVDAGMTASDDDMEEQIAATLFALKVKSEAERRLLAELFSGSAEITWQDLEEARREFLIDDLLPNGGTCVICARSNLGKTFTYIDMVCRMIVGMPWLGKRTRRVKVLIVLGEGKAGFMSRLRGWMTAHGKTPDDIRPWMSFIDRANLNNDESLKRIREVAEREEVGLVIYDTWAAASGIQKEDDAVLTSRTINRVKDAMPDLTHLFIHHPRKAEQDTDSPVMRGSGAFEAAADIVMMMYADRKFIPASGESFDFIALSTEQDHNGKARDAQTETIRGLYLDEVELPDGSVSRVMRLLDSETISTESREVRRVLTRPMSHAEYTLASGKSRSTAYRYLQQAVADGIARKEPGPLNVELYVPTQQWTTLLSESARA